VLLIGSSHEPLASTLQPSLLAFAASAGLSLSFSVVEAASAFRVAKETANTTIISLDPSTQLDVAALANKSSPQRVNFEEMRGLLALLDLRSYEFFWGFISCALAIWPA